MSARAAHPRDRFARAPLVAFDARRALVLVLVLYAVAAAALVGWYGSRAVFVDESEYLRIAGHIVESGVYMRDGTGPDALRPPGYPFALVPFAFVGAPIQAVRAAQLLLLALAVVALARARAVALPGPLSGPLPGPPPRSVPPPSPAATRRAFPPFAGATPVADAAARDRRAVIMLGLVAASPVLPFTANLLFPQTLLAATFVGVLLWTLAPERTHGPLSALATGLACSYAVIVSPTALTIAPVAAWTLARRSRAPVTCFVLVAAMTLSLPAAWTVRNRLVLGEWIPISKNLSTNLDIAWTVSEAHERGVDLAPGATTGAGLAAGPRAGGPLRVLRDLVSAPGEYLKRLGHFFDSGNELQTEAQMSAWRVRLLAASYYSLLALVLLRLAVVRRARLSDAERAVLALYALTALFHALVFARVRYRLPFDVLMLLPAANALLVAGAAIVSMRRGGRPRATDPAPPTGDEAVARPEAAGRLPPAVRRDVS